MILIDNQYYAAATAGDGTYEFSIPEGTYTFSFINYYYPVPGEFQILPGKGKNVYLDIKGDFLGILSAYWNDDVGSYLKIIGGRENDETFRELFGNRLDTIQIIAKRKGIDVDQSGRNLDYASVYIDKETINNTGIRGIQNLVSKTSGVVEDLTGKSNIYIRGGRSDKNLIIIDGKEEETNYVEAETRTDFRDAVYWTSSVVTDDNGEAKIKMKFPDNLTTWRVTAKVITKDTKVGQNSSSVISRKDLIVRMEAPRFLQEKDEVVISTILHNYLNEEKQTKVTLNLDNLKLDPLMNPVQIIKLGKNEERRIDWKVKVTEPKGMAKLYASALTNEESDAVEVKVPLQPHGLKISNYMSFDISNVNGSHTETFELPEDADLRSSSLRIGISPSIASSILGSLEALLGYPYGCMEQTMSRFIPTIIAANVLKETGLSETEFYAKQMPKMVKLSFAKVKSMQHNDGGWGWWSNGASSPFMSAYVVYGLSLAESAGFKVDKDVYKKGITFLLNNIKIKSINNTTRAYMIYALAQTDSVKHDVIKKLLNDIEGAKLNDFDKGLLSLAAGKTGEKEMQRAYNTELVRNVNINDDGAWWGGKSEKYYNWYDDNIQATSIVLKALLADAVTASDNKDVIEKTVQWLMAKKKGVYWCNTQQSAFAIYALTDYLKSTNELNPDYSLKIFVNNNLLSEKQVTREDILKKEISVYADDKTLKHGKNTVRIEKNGLGKSYITTTEIYYTSDKKVKSRDDGFDITRTYYKLEKFNDYKNNKIVYRKKTFDGEVKSGDVVLVKVIVTPTQKDNQYFMLEDPIPAGCEVVKDDWAYPIEKEKNYEGYNDNNWRWWYSNKEVRDNRVVFFASSLGSGEFEFSYMLRAETLGTFNVMPSHGSLMYYPDISGSGDEIKVRIGE